MISPLIIIKHGIAGSLFFLSFAHQFKFTYQIIGINIYFFTFVFIVFIFNLINYLVVSAILKQPSDYNKKIIKTFKNIILFLNVIECIYDFRSNPPAGNAGWIFEFLQCIILISSVILPEPISKLIFDSEVDLPNINRQFKNKKPRITKKNVTTRGNKEKRKHV